MNNIYLLIPDKIPELGPLALATVVETKGSTPQKHGSSALFGSGGLISGTIGGGVLEGNVQQIAQKVIRTKKSGLYNFNFNKDISFKQDAICGGQATVLLDGSPDRHIIVFEQIKESLRRRIPGVLVTIVSGVEETNKDISRYWITAGKMNDLPKQYSELLGEEAEKLFSASSPYDFKRLELTSKREKENVLAFLEPILPSSHLIIAGAGHIGKVLAHLGKLLDFEVTIVDDRAEFANNTNIPDADHIIVEDIGKAIRKLTKNSDTYVVIVTRGHDDDAKALKPCINTGLGYVGMIGSKSKIAKMHRNFVQKRWATEEQWSSIHAPIGLAILSKTVEEIAVSIAAQLVLIRNSKK
jgi:xanthine dehydrogenase accessory factor